MKQPGKASNRKLDALTRKLVIVNLKNTNTKLLLHDRGIND